MASANGSNEPEWHLLESAPEVFTELCESLGVANIEFREVYGTDEDSFRMLSEQVRGHIHGFVFLFKWEKDGNPPRPTNNVCTGAGTTGTDIKPETNEEQQPSVFFAQQLVANACATYAILNILMNCQPSTDPRLGDTLETLKSFTEEFDSNTKGMAVAGNETLRTAHNAFKAKSILDYVSLLEPRHQAEDAFHYLSYVPVDNKLLELDGLEQQYFVLSSFDGSKSDFLEAARTAIANRIRHVQSLSSAADEIRFSLMAVTSNQSLQLAKQLALQLEYRKLIKTKISTGTDSTGEATSDTCSPDLSADVSLHLDSVLTEGDRQEIAAKSALLEVNDDTQDAQLNTVLTQIMNLEGSLQQELAAKRRTKHENVLRRTNYLPAVLSMLEELAKRAELDQALALSKIL